MQHTPRRPWGRAILVATAVVVLVVAELLPWLVNTVLGPWPTP